MLKLETLLLIGLFALAAISPASADTARSGTNTAAEISVTIPEGLCQVSAEDPVLAPTFEMVRSGLHEGRNQLAIYLADCAALERLRTIGGVHPYSQWVNINFIYDTEDYPTPLPANIDRAALLELLSGAQQGMDKSEVTRKVRAIADKKLKEICGEAAEKCESGDPVFLGQVDRDELAIYSAVLTSTAVGGESQTSLGVAAVTLVKRYPVAINVFAKYDGTVSIDDLLARTKAFAAELIADDP
jgi:hypothetical protein